MQDGSIVLCSRKKYDDSEDVYAVEFGYTICDPKVDFSELQQSDVDFADTAACAPSEKMTLERRREVRWWQAMMGENE